MAAWMGTRCTTRCFGTRGSRIPRESIGSYRYRSWSISRGRSVPKRKVTCMGLFGLGLPEVAVIAGVAALLFGPSKLPELGKELGKTVKSFKDAAKEFETEMKAGMESEEDSEEKASENQEGDRKQS